MSLQDEIFAALGQTMIRKASTTCSRWSENYVVVGMPIPGPVRFDRFPWTREMCDQERSWVGMKSAQMGYTQTALHRALFRMDTAGISVLYILPKRSPDATDFSRTKFDSLLEQSPHLDKMFSKVRNVGHKRAGNADFFLRGSRSRSGLKSVSVGLKVFDEYDEMFMKNVALAQERSSGYDYKDTQDIYISTPTLPGFGIDLLFRRSTRGIFIFPCPHCGKLIDLTFPESLVITAEHFTDEDNLKKSHIICKECKEKLDHEHKIFFLNKGHWHHQKKSDFPGYSVNQMYSTTVPPWKIAESYLKGLDGDEAEEQEFWNSKQGKAHQTKDSVITDDMILKCLRNHRKSDPPPYPALVTIGCDVGKKLHINIAQWMLPEKLNRDLCMLAVKRILWEGKVDGFSDLADLKRKYQSLFTVIDVDPETRKAFEFCENYNGHAAMCRFVRGISQRNIQYNEREHLIHCRRTSWLDLSQGRFKDQKILLPADTSQEFREHVKAVVRKPEKDENGNPIAKYISTGPDHSALANLYSEVALLFAVAIQTGTDVKDLS